MSVIFSQDGFDFTPEIRKALVVSVLLHVGIVVAGVVGMPYISKVPIISQPISIEIINPADITTTNKPPSKSKLKPVVEEPKKAPKVEKKVVAPPKVEAKEPPKIKPLEKPVVKKDTVKPKPKPKPKTPPLPTEKVEKEKPKPPEKKKEEPKKEEAIEQEDPLASLMKNLQESEELSDEAGDDEVAETNPDAPFSETMTQNELGALTNQLVGCWQIPIGAKDVHNMVVNVRVWANADRTVRRVEIEDKWRIASDPAFRALAESAERAVRDPACSPLKLPEGKSNIWKDQYIVVPFDPSHVT